VEGGGHNWPGGGLLPEAIVGHMTEDIDASALMWEFFVQHPLR
jgi:poly(3-hydroxybutyrate) depolymerase